MLCVITLRTDSLRPTLLSIPPVWSIPPRSARRGLPGSGKSHVAKRLRDIEVEEGGEPPRVHSLDEYFMTVSAVQQQRRGEGRSAALGCDRYNWMGPVHGGVPGVQEAA